LQPDSGSGGRMSNRMTADGLGQLFASASFPALKEIDLSRNHLSTEERRPSRPGRSWRQLRDLGPCGNAPIGTMGVKALADSPHLRPGCRLALRGNPLGREEGSTWRGWRPTCCRTCSSTTACWRRAAPRRWRRRRRSGKRARCRSGATTSTTRARSPWRGTTGRCWKTLSLGGCRLRPKGVGALADAPGLANLRHLHLSSNPISDEGGMAMALGKGLPRLEELRIDRIQIKEPMIEAALRERYGPALRL